MSAWSKQWQTGNRATTERRGMLNECGGAVAKHEEEEHDWSLSVQPSPVERTLAVPSS